MKKTKIAAVIILFFSIASLSKETKNKVNLGDVEINTNQDFFMEIKGPLKISNGQSGFVGLKASSNSQETLYVLPPDGTSGQILTTDGSGALSWMTIGQTNGTSGQVLTTNGSGTLSWTNIHRASCPSGFNLIGNPGTAENFCISANPEAANSWIGAITNCYNKPYKSHLCSASEWAMSCISDKSNATNMIGHWEWVSDSGNNYGRIVGLAGCDSFNGAQVDAKYSYRCCFR